MSAPGEISADDLDPDSVDLVRALIAALQDPGAINPGLAAALIEQLTVTLEYTQAQDAARAVAADEEGASE